jgi:hypothetical protein
MSQQGLIQKAPATHIQWTNPWIHMAPDRNRTFCLESPPIRFPASENPFFGLAAPFTSYATVSRLVCLEIRV